jgi:hypothetical protein
MIALASPLARLRRPLITGALALLAGGALLLWSQAERNDAEAALRLHTNRLTQARALHQAAREADAAARDGLRQLETLRGAGLLEAPDRQAWQRHLLGLQGKLGLEKLEWEIARSSPPQPKPRRPAEQPSALHLTTLHLKGESPTKAAFSRSSNARAAWAAGFSCPAAAGSPAASRCPMPPTAPYLQQTARSTGSFCGYPRPPDAPAAWTGDAVLCKIKACAPPEWS